MAPMTSTCSDFGFTVLGRLRGTTSALDRYDFADFDDLGLGPGSRLPASPASLVRNRWKPYLSAGRFQREIRGRVRLKVSYHPSSRPAAEPPLRADMVVGPAAEPPRPCGERSAFASSSDSEAPLALSESSSSQRSLPKIDFTGSSSHTRRHASTFSELVLPGKEASQMQVVLARHHADTVRRLLCPRAIENPRWFRRPGVQYSMVIMSCRVRTHGRSPGGRSAGAELRGWCGGALCHGCSAGGDPDPGGPAIAKPVGWCSDEPRRSTALSARGTTSGSSRWCNAAWAIRIAIRCMALVSRRAGGSEPFAQSSPAAR